MKGGWISNRSEHMMKNALIVAISTAAGSLPPPDLKLSP